MGSYKKNVMVVVIQAHCALLGEEERLERRGIDLKDRQYMMLPRAPRHCLDPNARKDISTGSHWPPALRLQSGCRHALLSACSIAQLNFYLVAWWPQSPIAPTSCCTDEMLPCDPRLEAKPCLG